MARDVYIVGVAVVTSFAGAAAASSPPAELASVTRDADGTVHQHVADGSATAGGTPLRLEFTCEDIGGGLFEYTFELIVDGDEGSFSPGNGWGWVVFGDQQDMPTNLTGFAGDLGSLPAGPFTQFQTTSGFHNGPTLGPVSDGGELVYWYPESEGESISWSGTSTAQLDEGELLFSTLLTDGGAVGAEFKPGEKVGGACPADCNGDGALNITDFVCFQGEWEDGTAFGDCNGDEVYDILDFICYQGLFGEGCP